MYIPTTQLNKLNANISDIQGILIRTKKQKNEGQSESLGENFETLRIQINSGIKHLPAFRRSPL